jgi:hypothetical protein
VSTRRSRLLTAGAFLIGFACFIGGLVIEFSVSQRLGWTMIGVGALIAGVSRLVARRLQLPAP